MLGTRLPGPSVALVRRSFCLLCLWLTLGAARAEIVNTAPVAQPALPAELGLPVDPTAPNTVGPSTAPAIPLIPAQPLLPPDRPPRAVTPAGSTDRVGALPGGLTTEPFAPTPEPAAAATAPDAPTTTVTDIGAGRRFQYNFGVTLGGTYDSNIFLEPNEARGDFYFTIQPTVSLGFGGGRAGGDIETVVRFTYSPQVLLYVSHPELDTVQHFVTFSGVRRFGKLTLTGTQDVQILDSTDVGNPHPFNQFTTTSAGGIQNGNGGSTVVNAPSSNVNLDVGQRTRVNIFSTGLLANYLVSDKVSYDLSGQFNVLDYAAGFNSSRTLSGNGFFNYSPTGKTTFGIGGSVGHVFADGTDLEQTFEQVNLRVSYVPSGKLAVSGQLGLEFRQDRHGKTQLTPIFGLNASYQPFDGTSLSLQASRSVQTSALVGAENYTSTFAALNVSQRLFQRFYCRLNIGYTNLDYASRDDANGKTDADANRKEDYFFVQPGLDFQFHENVVVGAFFSYRNSASSSENRNFEQEQSSLRMTIAY